MGKLSFNVVFFAFNFVLFIALVSLQYGFFTARHAINIDTMCDRLRELDALEWGKSSNISPAVVKSSADVHAIGWNEDWDGRHQQAVQDGLSKKPSTMRRIWLIRHGEYFPQGPTKGHLTDKGRKQAELIGKRLQATGIRFERFVMSTSIRARETAEIVLKFIPKVTIEKDDVLKEGEPVRPDPAYQGMYKDKKFDADGLRIEQAFRKYIQRPEVNQKYSQVNEIIVAHGNVIGYFALRGLQVPPERWLKLQVIQGSISMFEVTSDGHVNVRILGDMGHIPIADWTG